MQTLGRHRGIDGRRERSLDDGVPGGTIVLHVVISLLDVVHGGRDVDGASMVRAGLDAGEGAEVR